MAKKLIVLCIVYFSFAGRALSQTPQIKYLRVEELPAGTLHILGKFDAFPGVVRMNDIPLTAVSWSDTEIVCDIDDSIYKGGIVTVINGTDSARELLSFWELHVEWDDIWWEGSEGDDQTVAWTLGFRTDLQALIDKRLSSVELQPTRRSTCSYSVNKSVSAVLSYSGSGAVPCKSAFDITQGPGFSVLFDIFSDLSTSLNLGDVTGYPMTADTGYWSPKPIPYGNYSFLTQQDYRFENLSPVIDSNYHIQPYEYDYWVKFNRPQTWIAWHTDTTFFLPPVSKASVTQSDNRARVWLTIDPVTSEYQFSAEARMREMKIYTSLGQLIQNIIIQPNQNLVRLPQLPVGLYFVRLDGLISKVLKY